MPGSRVKACVEPCGSRATTTSSTMTSRLRRFTSGTEPRTLKRDGSARSSFTRMHKPMSVAMLQCCTVGVNSTLRVKADGCLIALGLALLSSSLLPAFFTGLLAIVARQATKGMQHANHLIAWLTCPRGEHRQTSVACSAAPRPTVSTLPPDHTAARMSSSPDAARIVSDRDVILAYDVELLEAVRVLRILYVANVLPAGSH